MVNKFYLADNVQQNMAQATKKVAESLKIFNKKFSKFLDNLLEVEEIKTPVHENIIIIGIGGSNLFAQAVNNFLEKNIFFLDSLDIDLVLDTLEKIDSWISDNKKFKIFIISKSGETLETIVNSSVIIDHLKSKVKKWQEYIIVISEHNSKLADWALDNNIMPVSVPTNIGGRFSFLTLSSLLPLSYAGIDVQQIIEGAQEALLCFEKDSNIITKKMSAQYAAYISGLNLHNLFIFDKKCFYLGQWYRQLFAESLGKNSSISFVPTVSVAADLHSMTQLYLAGKNQWYTNFLYLENKNNIKINNLITSQLKDINYNLFSKKLESSLYLAWQDHERSYNTINLKDDLNSLGNQCMNWVIELLFFSLLLDVDPFGQPAVESYKKYLKKDLYE